MLAKNKKGRREGEKTLQEENKVNDIKMAYSIFLLLERDYICNHLCEIQLSVSIQFLNLRKDSQEKKLVWGGSQFTKTSPGI